MEMIENIKKAYYIVNEKLSSKLNTQEVRVEVIQRLLDSLKDNDDKEIRIICDEANNTPKVIESHQLIARVEWKMKNRFNKEIKYVDLVFGDNVELEWR